MTSASHAPHSQPPRNHRSSSSILTAGWAWGLILTFAFYTALPSLPVYRDLAQRYFCAHWIEYATTGLFFIGMASAISRSLRIPAERFALQADVLEGLSPRFDQHAVQTAEQIEQHLRLVARQSSHSIVVRRIREICEYVRARCSADGLETHLTYLADLASSRLHESYSLIRTITWAVPILGFLGTVIGITMAIANVTPDQLSSSLNEVTAGLAVAFDTTALSLALSMILVFSTFLVEKSEQQLLDGVEDFLVQRLTALFPAQQSNAQHTSLLDAESATAQKWIEETEVLIRVQQEEWRQTLENVRHRWHDTLEHQQQLLAESLQSATTNALADHAQQLATLRQEMTAAIVSSAQTLASRWEDTQRSWQVDLADSRRDVVEIWTGFREELQAATASQTQHSKQLFEAMSQAIAGWQSDLQQATEIATSQLAETQRHGEILVRLAGQENELIQLEETLNRNLATVHVAESLEETILNLNAAIHLLTARALPKAA